MQRFSSARVGGGAGNNASGGSSSRENGRAESSFANSNYSSNTRRSPPLVPYKLKCDKEPLNSRLGPPDFRAQTPNCPEETITGEYIQSGYRETVEGLEEARELVLSQSAYFSKPEIIQNCREGIKKRFRALNEIRAQKRKAGQVYGVSLSGALLIKPGTFPEQRACGEDARRKWIEALSQQHNDLHSLADHVPLGYRKRSLFEILIRHKVPLLRATWFIKVTYLNQVHGRPTSTNVSDKAQFACTDLWTKDVIEYLQQILDDFISKDKDFSSDSSPVIINGVEEPSLQIKWWYMLRLLDWHYAEGLLVPPLVIDWVLNQLQEKESANALELLLPILSHFIENISSSQTYVRTFMDVAVRTVNDISSKVPSLAFSMIEMLHYLVLSVPDTFVAIDCSSLPAFKNILQNAEYDAQDASIRYVVSTIKKRASRLAKIVNPDAEGRGAVKVVQFLDKALLMGDVKSAYHSVFEDLSDVAIDERWLAGVSPWLMSSLEWIGTVSSPLICSIFFLFEWATCDYRDCRTAFPQNLQFTGAKDISQVYFAVLLSKLRKENDRKRNEDIFQSPGPLHDIVVCWLDQHEIGKGGSLKRLQVLIVELIRNGLFYPQAYLRQLIISGIMDRNETTFDLERRGRHRRIIKNLPGSALLDILDEAGIAEVAKLHEVVRVYTNERQIVLHGHFNDHTTSPKTKNRIIEAKVLVTSLLRLPCCVPVESLKRTSGCEECRKSKRQKLVDDKIPSNQSEDDDTWWVSKGIKSLELSKVEAFKSTKNSSRGRPKNVRKTQSLAQLAACSNGASTSHSCENNIKALNLGDIKTTMKQLKLVEKRTVSIWLLALIKNLVEESGKAVNSSSFFPVVLDNGSIGKWKLDDVELSLVLYVLDISSDLVSAVRLILWLLRKIISGKNTAKNRKNHVVQVSEAFLLSSLQRYENVFVASDLLPEVLTAAMHRSASVTASNGRNTTAACFVFARNLLKKYKDVSSVKKWENRFRATSDRRLLAELETARALDGDGYASGIFIEMGDFDEYFRQKITARISRTNLTMKDVVQKHVERALQSPAKFVSARHVAQDIVQDLVNCIRQNGGASLDGDPNIVTSAVSAILNNVGPAITESAKCVQQILHIHIFSLGLLKEALGERIGRIVDLSLVLEASTSVSGAFSHGKIRLETNDMNSKIFAERTTKAAAAISALLVGVIVHGVVSLERMIVLFKLREGLDVLQFIRNTRTSQCSIEAYVHWFRLLIGNCRTIFDGLVAQILGEPYILALSRMQRMLTLNIVFPPAYSIFAMVIWRPYIINSNVATREDVQLYHNLFLAIGDAIGHHPFRDLCLRETHVFYNLLSTDTCDSGFAAMFEMHKTMAFVPLRARMFLNAIIDCKMPLFTLSLEDGSWVSGSFDTGAYAETEAKLMEKLLHVLDTLQPAKFHWQWVELRLLLNELALLKNIETKDMSLVKAIQSLSPSAENHTVSDTEKSFSQVILTRILVRPDAAPFYAEVARLLGKSLEESLLMDVRWLLGGSDVLPGKKSVRQRLMSLAKRKGLPTKAQLWKPWGWSSHIVTNVKIEEGEVKKPGKSKRAPPDIECFYATEKAVAELMFPCIDRCSGDVRNSFAAALISQMKTLDKQMNKVEDNAILSVVEGTSKKRKDMRGGGSALGRRASGSVDLFVPSVEALKASIWLRMQFIMRLLPVVFADRSPSPGNMRCTLATYILHFLGNRFIYDDTELSTSAMHTSSKRKVESVVESDRPVDNLFDLFLSVLHGLLSSTRPSWLKPMKSRDFSPFDHELAEKLQAELKRMELPNAIRHRIQSAMPILPNLTKNSDIQIDPWALLEEGAAGSVADHSNLKASSFLNGAVRVRRKNLTYLGSLDEDS